MVSIPVGNLKNGVCTVSPCMYGFFPGQHPPPLQNTLRWIVVLNCQYACALTERMFVSCRCCDGLKLSRGYSVSHPLTASTRPTWPWKGWNGTDNGWMDHIMSLILILFFFTYLFFHFQSSFTLDASHKQSTSKVNFAQMMYEEGTFPQCLRALICCAGHKSAGSGRSMISSYRVDCDEGPWTYVSLFHFLTSQG